MTLGDMGADVVRLEEPGRGDESRAARPPLHGGESPYFLTINRSNPLSVKGYADPFRCWLQREG